MPKVITNKVALTLEERRLRKQQRRDAQRQANIGRARKMHELRLLSDKTRAPYIAETGRASARTIYNIGCSGWYYWHLRDSFYKSLPASQWFEHYASKFQTVEINASFYSWPTQANVMSWIRQAGRKKFIYTVKVPELITHIKRFKNTKTLIRDFGYVADLLGPRMGCFLFQLPPSFKYTPARLRSIVEQLDSRHRNVVEFRHASWWNADVFEAFRNAGIIFCSCSGPRLPDELVKTSDDVYIRFHGVKRWYRHDYTKEELAEWARRISESDARRAWMYFNNDNEGYAVRNARQMAAILKKLA